MAGGDGSLFLSCNLLWRAFTVRGWLFPGVDTGPGSFSGDFRTLFSRAWGARMRARGQRVSPRLRTEDCFFPLTFHWQPPSHMFCLAPGELKHPLVICFTSRVERTLCHTFTLPDAQLEFIFCCHLQLFYIYWTNVHPGRLPAVLGVTLITLFTLTYKGIRYKRLLRALYYCFLVKLPGSFLVI